MKTIVIGAKGFIGSHFHRFYRQMNGDAIGTHYEKSIGYQELNLLNPTLNVELTGYKYALICAGIANPEKCEKEPDLSYRINVLGILEIVRFLRRNQIIPIIISSGYVFDGIKGAYREDDPISPVNVYGRHKADLEKLVEEECLGNCLIIRLAKVYGLSKGDGTIIDEIVTQLMQGKEIRAATDQIMSPISIHDVVRLVYQLQKNHCRGLYHLGGSTTISRYQLSLQIAESLGKTRELVRKISLDEISSHFLRAKKTDLNAAKIFNETKMASSSLADDMKKIIDSHLQSNIVSPLG